MKIKNKKYIVKIPDKIHVFYYKKKKFIIIKGPINQKIFKTETKIKIKINTIEILPSPRSTNSPQKILKSNQGTAAALIEQLIIQASTIFYKKLNFIGIGYRAFFIENNILLLKLGFSHPIYFNIPINFKISCLKLIKLFISGNSYQNISDITAIIRNKKLPEPYKGKGILYEKEKIKIKEGKKI